MVCKTTSPVRSSPYGADFPNLKSFKLKGPHRRLKLNPPKPRVKLIFSGRQLFRMEDLVSGTSPSPEEMSELYRREETVEQRWPNNGQFSGMSMEQSQKATYTALMKRIKVRKMRKMRVAPVGA